MHSVNKSLSLDPYVVSWKSSSDCVSRNVSTFWCPLALLHRRGSVDGDLRPSTAICAKRAYKSVLYSHKELVSSQVPEPHTHRQ